MSVTVLTLGGVRGLWSGVGQIQCTDKALLQRSCGAVVAVPPSVLGSRRGKVGWSLSVGSPVVKVSAGGPQPALPLLRHFPVGPPLVLVSPLLPPEEAELRGKSSPTQEVRRELPLNTDGTVSSN